MALAYTKAFFAGGQLVKGWVSLATRKNSKGDHTMKTLLGYRPPMEFEELFIKNQNHCPTTLTGSV